jgi:hypothetical protein
VHPADGTCGRSPLNKELGSGGMGVVREAEETSLPRTDAIRMMRGSGMSSAGIARVALLSVAGASVHLAGGKWPGVVSRGMTLRWQGTQRRKAVASEQ